MKICFADRFDALVLLRLHFIIITTSFQSTFFSKNASGGSDINSSFRMANLSAWRNILRVLLFSDEKDRASSRVRYIVIVSLQILPGSKPKSLFKFAEIRLLVCYCTHEEKINFEDFTQNGCYGNQPQPLEVLFNSIDANNPSSFVGFYFFLCNKLKFWQSSLVLSVFYRLYFDNLILHQIQWTNYDSHVTDINMKVKSDHRSKFSNLSN